MNHWNKRRRKLWVSSFILTIDRQFVSVLFDIETYASYAFAYNLLSLITTVISAISTVLYPTIKTYDEKTLFLNYNTNTNDH